MTKTDAVMRAAIDACVEPSLRRLHDYINNERPMIIPAWAKLSRWIPSDEWPEAMIAGIVVKAKLTVTSGFHTTEYELMTNPNIGAIYGAHPEELGERAISNIWRAALIEVNKHLAAGALEVGIAIPGLETAL